MENGAGQRDEDRVQNNAAVILEAMSTARSIHRYLPDPVPEADLSKILYAATRAPSGTNRQPFRFVVLRDSERARRAKGVLGEAFRRGWSEKAMREDWSRRPATMSRRDRSARAIQEFVDNFESIPVVVLACFCRYREANHGEGASVFPACQNLLLAARALGYGACFSGWHHLAETELRNLLGIPDDVVLSLTITLGRPAGRHGPLRRLPVRKLVFEDGWLEPAAWIDDPAGARLSRASSANTSSDD
jgi:nitroreductase